MVNRKSYRLKLHCLKCRKNTESKNPKAVKTKNRRIMLLSKSKFFKKQGASGLISSFGMKVLLSKIPLLGPLLFQRS